MNYGHSVEVITTGYSQGIGHSELYKQGDDSAYQFKQLLNQANGITHGMDKRRIPKPPTIADVMYSLLLDDATDYVNFEDWADQIGYDTDSREAERTYKSCLDIGLAINARVPSSILDDARVILEDF